MQTCCSPVRGRDPAPLCSHTPKFVLPIPSHTGVVMDWPNMPFSAHSKLALSMQSDKGVACQPLRRLADPTGINGAAASKPRLSSRSLLYGGTRARFPPGTDL